MTKTPLWFWYEDLGPWPTPKTWLDAVMYNELLHWAYGSRDELPTYDEILKANGWVE